MSDRKSASFVVIEPDFSESIRGLKSRDVEDQGVERHFLRDVSLQHKAFDDDDEGRKEWVRVVWPDSKRR